MTSRLSETTLPLLRSMIVPVICPNGPDGVAVCARTGCTANADAVNRASKRRKIRFILRQQLPAGFQACSHRKNKTGRRHGFYFHKTGRKPSMVVCSCGGFGSTLPVVHPTFSPLR